MKEKGQEYIPKKVLTIKETRELLSVMQEKTFKVLDHMNQFINKEILFLGIEDWEQLKEETHDMALDFISLIQEGKKNALNLDFPEINLAFNYIKTLDEIISWVDNKYDLAQEQERITRIVENIQTICFYHMLEFDKMNINKYSKIHHKLAGDGKILRDLEGNYRFISNNYQIDFEKIVKLQEQYYEKYLKAKKEIFAPPVETEENGRKM